MKWIIVIITAGVMFFCNSLEAKNKSQLKRLVALDIINIEGNSEYGYLEASITEAIQKMLKEKFAFRELSKYSLRLLARKNYIFRKDYYTRTAAMAVGLLGKLDIVIAGGFKIKQKQKDQVIQTTITIYDIKRKSIISKFTIDGPADNRLWNSVERIAKRISKEAKRVLPNKKEWLRSGNEIIQESLPIVTNVSIGLSSGLGIYFAGYADQYTTKQPAFGAYIKGNVPFVEDKLFFQIDGSYMSHTVKKSTTLAGINITVANYMLGFSCGYDMRLFGFLINPRIGLGYFFQNIEMSGFIDDTYTNSFPYVAAAFDVTYSINDHIGIMLSPVYYYQFQNNNTMLGIVNIGINLRFN